MRLTWPGNMQAQQESDDAYRKLRKKRKSGHARCKLRKKDFDYNAYLKTKHWKQRRAKAIQDADGKCEQCKSTVALSVHHRTYVRLYGEKKEDLVVLCIMCHLDKHPQHIEKCLPGELRCPRF